MEWSEEHNTLTGRGTGAQAEWKAALKLQPRVKDLVALADFTAKEAAAERNNAHADLMEARKQLERAQGAGAGRLFCSIPSPNPISDCVSLTSSETVYSNDCVPLG